MENTARSLDNVRVASPCHARWEEMKGSESVRFCAECRLNVYNLSAMARPEAEALVAGAEGRLCIRYYRRSDGTILTQDCPVGVRTTRERLMFWARSITAAALAFIGGSPGSNTALAGGNQPVEDRSAAVMGDTIMVAPVAGDVDTNQPACIKEPEGYIGGVMRRVEPDVEETRVQSRTPRPEGVMVVDTPAASNREITIPSFHDSASARNNAEPAIE